MSLPAATMEPILTVKQVAELLNVRPRTVYDLANLGESDPSDPKGLPFMFRVGGSWRARLRDIQSWIDKQATVSN